MTRSQALRQRLCEEAERQLTPDEVRAWLDAPIGDDERRQALELIRWFTTRYTTPADRLAYVRRAYRRWTADR